MPCSKHLYIYLILVLFLGTAHALDPIRVGTNIWPGYEPLHLAKELNYFDSKQIRLVEYPSSTEVLRAFRNKSIEAAALTLDEVLMLRQANIPVSVVLVLDISNGGDVILAKPGITTFKELKGKRVAVESGALGAYVITRALEINDMTLQDITIVNMEVDSHEEAYARDLIDAMVTFEPVRTRLISEGGNEVFSSREIPGEIVDVLVVHEDILNNKQHTQVKDLINAWFRALDYLTNKKHSAAGILSARLKISAEEVIESFNGLDLPNRQDNLDLLGGDSPRLELVLKRLHNTLLQNELLIKPVSFNGLLYSDILQD